jgi:predicted DNA-binding transcriptional regulator AlpA
MPLDTLPNIGEGLGLNRGTLNVLRWRHKDTFPQPRRYTGRNKGVSLYDVSEVEAWYVARSFQPIPKRGADRQPRKRRSSHQSNPN